MKDWSARQYLKFSGERTRPARDLINAITMFAQQDHAVKNIIDIGCGPGNSTQFLRYYWPEAKISGFDNSPNMIAKAQSILPDVDFYVANIEAWHASQEYDLLYSNAAFQWLPNHIDVLKRLVGEMKTAACLAIQMPDNLHEPLHLAMIEVAQDKRWQSRIGNMARHKLPATHVYYDFFAPLVRYIDVWHSIYNHIMDSHEAIIDWVKGAALRPFLEPLDTQEQQIFIALYLKKITKAYPVQADGKVLLRFPRFFMVLVK